MTLKKLKSGLNMFKAKIRLTYEPIPEVFRQIKKELNTNIGEIFLIASEHMEENTASEAWKQALEEKKIHTSFTKEDIEVLKGLSKMLGSMDLEGQINNIDLINELLNNQIQEATLEKSKNEKMYKTLGISVGLTIAIILV